MCGIIGVIVNNNHNKLIRNLYEIFVNQQTRGTQGAGLAINNGADLFRYRTVSPTRLFNVYNYWVWKKVTKASRVIIHHRTPTSTPNLPHCNHPIANEDGSIMFMHNGVVSNDNKLYKELSKTHKFETIEDKDFTDSEVIVHVFEDALKDSDVATALREVYRRVNGSYALAFILKGDPDIYLMRCYNPIVISKDAQDNFYFSSELKINGTLTHEHTMEDGEIGKLTATGYVKLDKIDIPIRKARQYTLYDERSWEDDDEPIVSLPSGSLTDGFKDGDEWLDDYGNAIVKKGDYWVNADKKMTSANAINCVVSRLRSVPRKPLNINLSLASQGRLTPSCRVDEVLKFLIGDRR